ncbi:beta-N-acetylhexosaminidase [Symbiobacterium terraclitae]|uniref:Beta-N-acetylhexosaminidase n=1 Tax=Symbiobacterium terraclitae TaxID=557451 RepID=A0ABS4JST9_9FIRM|nr:beta-N-acetylhexosaminidase [Symbiobacterium terraclitae]MBP2018592.1 beta-N-acetylhexosaminidase [Symbiobacterium terraclitae]
MPVRLSAKLLRCALSVLLLATTGLWGCGRGGAPGPQPSPPPTADGGTGQEPGGEPAPPESVVGDWLEYLTLEEKLGQLVWVGLPGTELTAEAGQLLAEGKAGGCIFFGRQGSDPETLRRLTADLQRAATARDRATPGLVIAVDHEGGLVQRFGPPFTQWPASMALGATGSAEYAEQVGRAMARELRAVGVNMNLAPVADVNNNPANPVIGTRSFGADPGLVARLTAAFIQGLQAEGVGAAAKHFPGHGDTEVDSHFALPVIPHDRQRLDQVELVPFRAAVTAGSDAIMAGHILFPAVAQDGRPASLSADMLTGLLKGELGYEGVVITDAMDGMAAITATYGVEEGLVLAIQAGADVVLIPGSFGREDALYGVLLQAVRDGRIPESRIEDAAARVLALKEKSGLLPPLPDAAGGEHTRTAQIVAGAPPGAPTGGPTGGDDPIGAPVHQELADRVGADALTLVRNAHLPLAPNPDDLILVIGPAHANRHDRGDGVVTALGASIKELHPNTREITLERSPSALAVAAARQMAAEAAVVVYAVSDGHEYPEHVSLMGELVAGGRPVVVVGLGMPRELTAVPEIATYIAAYGDGDAHLKGVGPLLFGRAEPRGRLPVAIPGLYAAGHGLDLH